MMKNLKGIKKDNKASREADMLKALNIPSFRHMSKDKILDFCGMLSEVDPEVAKAAIAQFPEFAKTVNAALVDYIGFAKEAVDKGSDSANHVFDLIDEQNKALMAALEKDELTLDEKLAILEQMAALREMAFKKDSENKAYSEKMTEMVSKALLTALCIALFAVVGRAGVSPTILKR